MVKTPEGKVKDAVKKVLDKHGVYYFMPVQAGYGKPGLDFHCIHKGRGFCIETKAPGKKPTPRQLNTMTDIRSALGVVFLIDGTDNTHTTELLDEWLRESLTLTPTL